MKSKIKWQIDEYEFIVNNYPSHGLKYCSEKLQRSKRAVQEKVNELKIKVNPELKRNVKYSYENVKVAVENSKCYADVLRRLGSIPQAGNFDNIKNRIREYDLDTSHFLSPGEITKLRLKEKDRSYFQQKPINELLTITDTRLDNRKIKKRLYKLNLKKEICELCGQDDNWNGKKLTLRLDHINGNNMDYRLENLRIICPNCDSTLDTYCSGNRKNKKIKTKTILPDIRVCVECNVEFKPNSQKHKHCSDKCRRKYNRE